MAVIWTHTGDGGSAAACFINDLRVGGFLLTTELSKAVCWIKHLPGVPVQPGWGDEADQEIDLRFQFSLTFLYCAIANSFKGTGFCAKQIKWNCLEGIDYQPAAASVNRHEPTCPFQNQHTCSEFWLNSELKPLRANILTLLLLSPHFDLNDVISVGELSGLRICLISVLLN